VKDYLIKEVRKLLPAGYDVQTHFTPRYNPWEQRLCLVPDSDLFESIASGRAQVVTDEIERFTAHGVLLKSGRELAADVVVTATGLQLQQLGGAALEVDGRAIDPADLVVYKGLMYAGLPNFAATFGYTNASWTLKADLTSRYVCRLLQHMKASGARVCTPRLADAAMALEPFVDFSSGYFQRELARLPKQGRVKPWKLNQNYLRDIVALRFSRIDDGVLQFGR
jgi:cation diffusion facilitator CzcD-associated flavoprotein CzcO